MKNSYKIAFVCLLSPLFVACSKGPSESEVENLITAQYDQAHSMMDEAMAGAGT